jgi:hypothetical protein
MPKPLRKRLPERAEEFRRSLMAPDLEHFKREVHFAVTGSYPDAEYAKLKVILFETQPHIRVFQMMALAWEFRPHEISTLFLSLPPERKAEINEILNQEIAAEIAHHKANS